jgi:hypothetical protein
LRIKKIFPTERLAVEKIHFIRPKLASPFRNLSLEVLSVLAFWMVLEKSKEENAQ